MSEPIPLVPGPAPAPLSAEPAKPKRHRSAAVVDVSAHLPAVHAAAAKAGVKPADATAQFRSLLQGLLAQAAATLIASFLQQAQTSIAQELADTQAAAAMAQEAANG